MADWLGEEHGANILTSIPNVVGYAWAIQICASHFLGVDP